MFVRVSYVLRPLLTTRLSERDMLRAAPHIAADCRQSVQTVGADNATMTSRIRAQHLGQRQVDLTQPEAEAAETIYP